ncbi:hypothetical protein PC123_g25806 [Phytophthora cactorum]|nr:hypothetical protein PC123_g25806 [Phytophthora cactorum]
MATFSRNFDLTVGSRPLPPLLLPDKPSLKDGQRDDNSLRCVASIFTRKREVLEFIDTRAEFLSALVPLTKLIADSKVSTSPTTTIAAPTTLSPGEAKPKRKKRIRLKTERRREQCRNNQARYRNRQRGFVRELAENVLELQEEIHKLTRERHTLCYSIQTKNNVWSVVVEYFRLLRYGFLVPMCAKGSSGASPTADLHDQEYFVRAVMTPDVEFGELCGVDALIDQWQRYSLAFGSLYFQLNQMEMQPFGAMEALATLSLTITEATLRYVFPHLLRQTSDNNDEESASATITSPLGTRLLGQRLDCRYSVRFSWDDSSGRVTRLRGTMDFLTPLLRVLGNLEEVSFVLKQALITPEYLIGEVPTRSGS